VKRRFTPQQASERPISFPHHENTLRNILYFEDSIAVKRTKYEYKLPTRVSSMISWRNPCLFIALEEASFNPNVVQRRCCGRSEHDRRNHASWRPLNFRRPGAITDGPSCCSNYLQRDLAKCSSRPRPIRRYHLPGGPSAV